MVEEDVGLEREDGLGVAATLVRPARITERLPAWVVLHGITRQGRSHPQLVRFTRALVSSGAVAIVPEVPEWRRFDLAPARAVPAVRAAVAALSASRWTRDAPVGVIGFSFGAPHAITATTHSDLRDDIAGSVSFGGYCDLERTIRFLMTGTHEWDGRRHRLTPDPYGRWIVAANYLTHVPGLEGATDVSAALRKLAARAGDSGVPSLHPTLDAYKNQLRASVAVAHRDLFDLFAPPAGTLPRPSEAGRMAEALAAAARAVDPTLEPGSALATVDHPVHVLHGRNDNLIPFSESLRMHSALPKHTGSKVTITRLFGHSAQAPLPPMMRTLRELPPFFTALRGVLRLV